MTATQMPVFDGRQDDLPVLQAEGVVAGYRDRRRAIPVVGPTDLRVQPGTFTAVLGPNGSGKTTLLRTLAGVMKPLEGQVWATPAGGRPTPLPKLHREQLAQHVAVVLTDHPDVGLLRAEDVVAIGRHPHTGWSGRLSDHDHEVIARSLAAVGATALAGVELARMSDGQRQRIWIARALAQQPKVLLLDEPTAFLDLPGRVETVSLLRDLVARDSGLAVVASIHDLDLALRIADRVWLVTPDGQVAVGAPEDLALAGEIDRAFGREDVRFDVATASFELPVDCCVEVRLQGAGGLPPDPTMALWTTRALTRAGAMIVDRPAWLTVLVPDAVGDEWQVEGPDMQHRAPDLASLVAMIRQMAAVTPATHIQA